MMIGDYFVFSLNNDVCNSCAEIEETGKEEENGELNKNMKKIDDMWST